MPDVLSASILLMRLLLMDLFTSVYMVLFPLGSAQNDDARHSIFAIGKSNSIINAVAYLICPLLLMPECSFHLLL